MSTLLNLACFQCVWLATVFGAATGCFWPGAVALALSIAVQSVPRIPVKLPSLGLLASVATVGFVLDSALALASFVSFPEGDGSGWPPPIWMSILWINFSTTLDESLAWAGERRVVAALAGAAGGPLAYLGGHEAGAIRLELSPESVLALACLWALAFPALAALARSRHCNSAPGAAPLAERRIR